VKLNTNILLAQLRKQPRHGADPNEDAKKVANDLKAAIGALPELSSLYEQYQKVLAGVNTEQAQLSQGLNQIIKVQKDYQTQITALYKSITFLEEENKALAKSFGLNTAQGQKLADSIRTLGKEFGIGDDKLFEYAQSLRDLTGGLLSSKNMGSAFAKQMIQTRQILMNNMGITAEAADGYELYAAGMGKSGSDILLMQEKIAKSIAGADDNKGLDAMAIQRDLAEEIGSLTADLQMRYNKIPGSLELAVLKSKALGLNMERLNAAGDNLLNIESSVGQELEYQLLSGQRLLTQDKKSLTDAYRRATIEGDADKQAQLMNHLLETQGDILNKNMFARKKAAELLGMDEATLAKSIQKREALLELDKTDLMNLSADKFEDELKKLEKEVGTDEKKQKALQKLKDATDLRTTEQQSLDALKNIEMNTKLAFSGKIDLGALQKSLVDQVKGKDSGFGKLVTQFDDQAFAKLVGNFTNISKVTDAVITPLQNFAKTIPYLGSQLETMIEKLKKVVTTVEQAKSVKDTLIIPDRGPILKPASNDVIAAFRPGDVIDTTLNSSAGGGANIDYAKLASAIASAMSNVKVEATVKTDTLYAATKLNGPRRFGQKG
jgi:hypothetical protein